MDNEQYDLGRLCATVSRHWSYSADGIMQALVLDVAAFIGAQTVFADITLVVATQR